MWHQYWVEERIRFYESIGLARTTLEEYWQKPEELAHYARATVDLLFKFPFGTQELEGIAARSDFDLSQHQRFCGKSMEVFDEELKAAWPKLDCRNGRRELKERYFQARQGYLARAGETAENVGPHRPGRSRGPGQGLLRAARDRAVRRRGPPGAGPHLQRLLRRPGARRKGQAGNPHRHALSSAHRADQGRRVSRCSRTSPSW